MKILYIAFACNPYTGSEAQCGWAWPMAMRQYAEVYVLTREENRLFITKFIEEQDVQNIHMFYYDIPEKLNFYYKYGKWYHLYYLIWQNLSFKRIKSLHEKYQFDYIHHTTLGDFRFISKAWRLNTKFIFGPVGGAQLTPAVFRDYVCNDIKTEKRRLWINNLVVRMPNYKLALNNAYLVLAANRETQSWLKKRMKTPEKCILLTENGVQAGQLNGMLESKIHERVILLWTGRMVNKKGLAFLLDVLPLVKSKNQYCLMLIGDGPEKRKLEEQVRELGLGDNVLFLGRRSYEETLNRYIESDIFVFPSLRETTGTVLFEAMAKGLPVVTFNQNGADMLIDDNCGRKANVNQNLENLKREFAAYLTTLIDDRELREKLGRNAYYKIRENYEWNHKCTCFYEKYLKRE